MTHRLARGRRQIPLIAAALVIGSLTMSSCVLSKIHSSLPVYRVVTGHCVFLGTTAASGFTGCNYSRADFAGDNAPGIDFNHTDWAFAMMNNMQLQSSTFVGSDFAHATLTNANLNAANLDHVNFTGATLSNTIFSNATLRGDDFAGANLHLARSLTAASLAGSLWRHTTCPDGTNSDHDGGTCVHDLVIAS